MYSLRKLWEADAARYNEFFAEGAAAHPRTLRIAPGDVREAPFPVAGLDRVTLLIEEAGEWLGVGTVERESGRAKRRHVAWIVRMLVTRQGAGVGKHLLERLLEEARGFHGVEKLNLTVAADNVAALRLYSGAGFVEFAREEDAFRAEGEPVTELTMSLRLG